MKKLIPIILGALLLINFVAATDVAYIVGSPFTENSQFISVLNELNLTYTKILAQNAKNTNFSDYRLILLNNEIFYNTAEIPINKYPSVMVDGDNMKDWGWTLKVSKSRKSIPFHFNLTDLSNPIVKGISNKDVQIYTSKDADIYYFGETNKFDGLITVASTPENSEDVVIAAAEAGSVLTKEDPITHVMYRTNVSANSVFFGAVTSSKWTNETRTMFKNSILWAIGERSFSTEVKIGNNLVSFPIILRSNSVSDLKAQNPAINSIKGFDENFFETSTVYNNKGYFINSSQDSIITVSGYVPTQTQNVQLINGMNLIGLTSLSSKTFAQVNLPSSVIEVSKRGDNGEYIIATKYGGIWFNEFELEPGMGYWFKTNAATNWSYNP